MVIKLHTSFAVQPGGWLRAEIIAQHHLAIVGARTVEIEAERVLA